MAQKNLAYSIVVGRVCPVMPDSRVIVCHVGRQRYPVASRSTEMPDSQDIRGSSAADEFCDGLIFCAFLASLIKF